MSDTIDATDAADLCREAHTTMVNLVMAGIELLDHVQRGEAFPNGVNVAVLRKQAGKQIRRSIMEHDAGLAYLMADTVPEYAQELVDHAVQFAHAPEAEGDAIAAVIRGDQERGA